MQGVFIGVVAAYVVIITILGPEYARLSLSSAYITDDSTFQRNHGSHIEKHKAASEGAGGDDAVCLAHRLRRKRGK